LVIGPINREKRKTVFLPERTIDSLTRLAHACA